MMKMHLTTQHFLTVRRSFIIRQQIRCYSIPFEVAEKIKDQLEFWDAQLLTPEDANPSSVYKGLVILAAGPIAKYPALRYFSVPYLKSGLPVITMNHSMASFGFSSPAHHKMSKVFDVVSANVTEPCPVVMKLYCGGATTYFPAAVEQFSKPGCKLKLAGIIFDSGPPVLTLREIIDSSKNFASQNRYPTWFHRMQELILPLILTALNGSRKRAIMERVMFSQFLHHTPQLFVYSTADFIINIDYINKVIDYQRQHNANVTTHTFSDTRHMLHRVKHPEEYDNLLFDFLKHKCGLPL